MSTSLTCRCPACHQYSTIDPSKETRLICHGCKRDLAIFKEGADIFEQCPVCKNCRQFYLMKDFNQLKGCLIMAGGIVLVPFTYGLSLPVFALADWLLYRRTPQIIVCYRCAAEFKGYKDKEKTLKPFMHHIGLKYDKYR